MTNTDTISALLQAAGAKLTDASDRESARFEARLLLQHILDCDRSFFFSHADFILEPEQKASFWHGIERRAAGEPMAYITGQRGFWRFEFLTDPAALIPRPDTELLVERALAILASQSIAHLADLGTGTGAIGLSIAAERPELQVHLVDSSTEALNLARKNHRFIAQQAGSMGSVALVNSDWLTAFAPQSLDMIVSNPPYINPDDPHLQQGDLRFEPIDALVAREQGLADFICIIDQATTRLRPGGWLLFEHGAMQGDQVRRLLGQAGFEHVRTHLDLAGHPRVTEGCFNKT